ncbi:MAG TPA: acyl-CoA dehydrogenase, partial [Brevundimonas sp.]
MEFRHSDRALHWQERVGRFLEDHVLPREAEYRAQVRENSRRQPPAMEEMKAKAREAGLWNMFLPGDHGAGLTNLEYAPLAELM